MAAATFDVSPRVTVTPEVMFESEAKARPSPQPNAGLDLEAPLPRQDSVDGEVGVFEDGATEKQSSSPRDIVKKDLVAMKNWWWVGHRGWTMVVIGSGTAFTILLVVLTATLLNGDSVFPDGVDLCPPVSGRGRPLKC